MSGKAIMVVLVLVLAAAGAYYVWSSGGQAGASAPAEAITAPPEGAPMLDAEWPPSAVVLAVAGKRTPAAQDEAEAQFVGLWVGEPGWNGAVEEVTRETGGVALRMYHYDTKIIGGGFWVVALVQAEDGGAAYKGRAVTVRGMIDRVEVLQGDLTPTYRIVLKPAWVVGG